MRGSVLFAFALFFPATSAAQTLVPADLVFDRPVTGLTSPVAAEFLPDGRLVIIQMNGQILVRTSSGAPLINSGRIPNVNETGEQGLLGLAIDPLFASSNRLYFYYTVTGAPRNNRHRVAWTTIDPATSIVDVASLSRREVLNGLYGPHNHNGGGIKFGPDGYLYVGVGDTGCNCGCAPGLGDNYFPTCLSNYQGKIMRIDRDGAAPVSNPLTNIATVPACGASPRPCASSTTGPNMLPDVTNQVAPRAQIYNWGFRNPWRFSWDERSGYLWIGDVGEVTWEEITISTGPGQHHGWPFREGAAGDDPAACAMSTPMSGNCKDPAHAYRHRGGASVTAGVFSNDCSWPAPWNGRYWFADFTPDVPNVWTLTPNAARDGVEPDSLETVLSNAAGIVHFFNGLDGAIYLVNLELGEIWRVGPQNPLICRPDAGPADTGPAPIDATPLDTLDSPDAVIQMDAANNRDANQIADGNSPVADIGSQTIAAKKCGCNSSNPASSSAFTGLLLLLFIRRRRL